MRGAVVWAALLLLGSVGMPAGAAEARVYEVVLEARPLNRTAYLAPTHAAYDVCAKAASILHRAAQPFPELPDDLVIETRTFASDGVTDRVRVDQLTLDLEALQPDLGCRIQVGQTSNTEIRRGRQMQTLAREAGGTVEVSPVTSERSPPGPSQVVDVARYSERRQVHGVALRCLGADHPLIRSGASLGACVFDDGHGGTLRRQDGRPLLLYAKMPPYLRSPAARTEIELTPRSVQLGTTLEPSAFAFRPAS